MNNQPNQTDQPNQLKTKDSKILFEKSANQPPYEFSSADLTKALAYAHEHNWPILAVKTPWYWLSVMDNEVGDKTFEIFN